MMTIDLVVHIIQFILAPAVMVSSGAIFVGSMQAHYGSISDRLRALSHERLQLLRQPDGSLDATNADAYTTERLQQIDTQIPSLLSRLLLVRNAILAMYLADVCFIASMFIIAIAAITTSHLAASVALYVFLASTAILIYGLFEMARNIRLSQAAVTYETTRMLRLTTRS
jgi:hypothetical protein